MSYDTRMSPARLEAVRTLSRALFGQTYRLEVMLAIARSETGLVTLTELATDLDVAVSNLQKPLGSLAAAGLIAPLPQGDSRRKFYIRNDSLAWEWVEELDTRVAEHVDTDC